MATPKKLKKSWKEFFMNYYVVKTLKAGDIFLIFRKETWAEEMK